MSAPSKSKSSPRVTVKVTEKIIETSTQRDSSHCMIADAVKAAVPDAKFISVDLATIRFTDLAAGLRYIYLTPRHAQAALLDFDQGKKPEPFTVKLAGAHVLMTGNARKARASLKQDDRWGKTPPVRVDGVAPPTGPLASGAHGKLPVGASSGVKTLKQAVKGSKTTGRRREFGLRAIIR